MSYSNEKINSSDKQKMGLCLINIACNSTQTSCGHNLLKTRIDATDYFRIEKGNEGIRPDEEYINTGKYLSLHCRLSLIDSFIVDIGHSSAEEILCVMSDIKDFHEDYDFFVITVVDSPRLLRDSFRTIKKLIEMGVPKYKIKILFSKFEKTNILTEEFYNFLLELEKINIKYNIDAAIKKSEVYDILFYMDIYFTDLNKNDLESNKIKMKELKKKNKKHSLTDKERKEIKTLSKEIFIQRVLSIFEPVFDNIFELLFPASNENY